MIIKKLSCTNFRNLINLELTAKETINIIVGDNAQGKTNVIEAIWLFTGTKSFRGARDREFINFNSSNAKLYLDFISEKREQYAEIIIDKKRQILFNSIPLQKTNELIGRFCAVIFSPNHISMVKESSAVRRKFLDTAICQIKPSYSRLLSEYIKILNQRNALLKDRTAIFKARDLLDIWDERLAREGARITDYRIKYIRQLAKEADKVYKKMTREGEKLSIRFKTFVDTDTEYEYNQLYQKLKSDLKQQREKDIQYGYSSTGPHRDDFEIYIDNRNLKLFGSQGELRSSVIALKLAEASLIEKVYMDKPIILLDDCLSELDRHRQEFLINNLDGGQLFITCCDPSVYNFKNQAKFFSMIKGQLREI